MMTNKYAFDRTIPPTEAQILYPPESPNTDHTIINFIKNLLSKDGVSQFSTAYEHPDRQKQKLYGVIKNLIGQKMFNQLPVERDKRILDGIKFGIVWTHDYFDKYPGMVRGSYYYHYSIFFFKCFIDNAPGSIFILDYGNSDEWWAIFSSKKHRCQFYERDIAKIERILTAVIENYTLQMDHGPYSFTITYRPNEKL